MSIVRYINKSTGAVAVYESTSHYDPQTKQSRPIRKYLGMEDPETGELIPSTGKRGRKKGSGSDTRNTNKKKEEADYRLLYEQCKKAAMEKDMLVRELQEQNKSLRSCIKRISEIAGTIISSERD